MKQAITIITIPPHNVIPIPVSFHPEIENPFPASGSKMKYIVKKTRITRVIRMSQSVFFIINLIQDKK
jgi:hypothetical protein